MFELVHSLDRFDLPILLRFLRNEKYYVSLYHITDAQYHPHSIFPEFVAAHIGSVLMLPLALPSLTITVRGAVEPGAVFLSF